MRFLRALLNSFRRWRIERKLDLQYDLCDRINSNISHNRGRRARAWVLAKRHPADARAQHTLSVLDFWIQNDLVMLQQAETKIEELNKQVEKISR